MSPIIVPESRNWMSYLMDSLVNSGTMPTWETAEYLTNNLVGEAHNPTLHHSKSPYETIKQFLHRVYGPIVEAASRAVKLPPQAMLHMFTDSSLMGKSAVLVVYFPGHNQPHQLLLLDSIPAWDLMFETSTAFNEWADEWFGWITSAFHTMCHQAQPVFVEQTEIFSPDFGRNLTPNPAMVCY